jgi:2-polyprenyl-3-methyl-5-hydroxy-6-metoxy-1,4-benzoquinol methylase
VKGRHWERSDTEAVTCCVCHREGRPIYDLDPFGVVRCPRCNLVFVSPRLTPESLQRMYDDVAYFEGDSGVYGTAGGRFSPAMQLQRQWTKGRLALAEHELSRPVTGARMLEVGCAYGLFLGAARERGYDVTGVELSQNASDHAREKLGLRVHTSQLADAPVTGPFDIICAWDTIEHVPDPVAFWRAVRKLLADDGVVVFSTPYFSSLPSRLLRTRWWTLKPTEHIWQLTPRTHRIVAEQADMRVTRIVRSPASRANLVRLDSIVGVARPA